VLLEEVVADRERVSGPDHLNMLSLREDLDAALGRDSP
jgi:hypothetical protein